MDSLNLTSIRFLGGNIDENDSLTLFINKLPSDIKFYIFYTYVYPDMIFIRYSEIIIHVESIECQRLTENGHRKLSELLKSIMFDKTFRPIIQKLCNNHSEFKKTYDLHRSGDKGFVKINNKINSLALSWMFYLYH